MAEGASVLEPPMHFVPNHLEQFAMSLTGKAHPDDMSGKRGQSFGEGLPGVTEDRLPAGLISRSRVLTLTGDPHTNTATVCAAIMAWGGMRMDHRDMAFRSAHTEAWVEIADRLRSGNLSRSEGYDAFRVMRTDGTLKGMGPAYFTKLIYFLMPRDNPARPPGFIMDQWAGCSINVLTARDTVLMDTIGQWTGEGPSLRKSFTFIVSDANTGENYEAFCAAIDNLARRFCKSGDEIDRALLSDGGRRPAAWRRHVMEQRRP